MNLFRLAFSTIALIFVLGAQAVAQFPGGGPGGQGRQMPKGRIYGKIVDGTTGKPIEFAAVQLFLKKKDGSETLVGGQLTPGNGDFSIDSVPAFGSLVLKASAFGFNTYSKEVSFGLQPGQGDMRKMMASLDKDLGNLALETLSVNLKEVTIEGSVPMLELKPDKKVFNVEKSPVATGGTAEDVLKTVPSVSVDLDGNVTMRNASPQLFVDGRPTTLTLDQIPADAIESVELITNPSAKYDASGGMAGILNIVLKKNRTLGYNGTVRLGADSRERINGGATLNVREGKVNWFGNLFLNQRKSSGTTGTERENFGSYPRTSYVQYGDNETKGFFGMARSGFDVFIDNRNTISVAGSYHRGSFDPAETIDTYIDTLFADGSTTPSFTRRTSQSSRDFRNAGGSLTFKHTYPTPDREITADVNYYKGKFDGSGDYFTAYSTDPSTPVYNSALQRQMSGSDNENLTGQVDYATPLKKNAKLETGVRGSYRTYSGLYESYAFDAGAGDFILQPSQTSDYSYTDQVYGAYATYSRKAGKMNYQAGLRVESSYYEGVQELSGQTFNNDFPFDLFPSLSASYAMNDKNDLQVSATRRINRPNFFQLIPYTDYSDSLNLRRGNPDITPEYTFSFELSHQLKLSRKNNVLTSVYYKRTDDLITQYIVREYDSTLNQEALISTYANALSGIAYGAEWTVQQSLFKWLDATANFNIYQSKINGSNIETDLATDRISWFGKLNLAIKVGGKLDGLSFQLSGDYHSRTALQQGGGERRGYWGGSTSTAQGYAEPYLDTDAAVKYEFLKNQAASVTVSMSDIFKTRKSASHTESAFYVQDTDRRRDAQVVRLNLSFRFGEFDRSLFKRRNNRGGQGDEMMDMGGM